MRAWVLLVIAGVVSACATPERVRLETPDGPLNGSLKSGTATFLGVPFAQSPTGDRRFAPPLQNLEWETERDATAYRPRCLQLLLDRTGVLEGSSEDCLYLNVYAPADAKGLPVMLYFPGGAYVIGGADEPMFEGSKLAKAGNVIVVTANYRLGPFGFLAHPALQAEAGNTGNFALLDQREAMRWVQRNIAAFGGDPGRVTLFGESAGAGSVCMHLLSEESAPLFQRAILQSAPCTAYALPTQSQARAQGLALSTALSCSGSETEVTTCLRNKSELEVIRALPLNTFIIFGEGVAWGPTVDGVVVKEQPLKMLQDGKSAPVPLIVGANADEGSLFFAKAKDFKTEADVRDALADLFAPTVIDAALAHYGLLPSAAAVGERMLGDLFFCDSRRLARLHAATQQPVYRYYFARNFFDIVLGLGAFHGAELPFLWDNSVQGLSVQPAGRALRSAMQGYWGALARDGDPNGSDRPGWSRFEPGRDNVLRLDVPISEEAKLREADCDFWDTQVELTPR